MWLRRPSNHTSLDLDTLRRPKDLLADTTMYWSPFPYGRAPVPLAMNALAQARFTMTIFISELNGLTLAEDVPAASAEFCVSVENLRERLHEWYSGLPTGLQYIKIMAAGLFELQ